MHVERLERTPRAAVTAVWNDDGNDSAAPPVSHNGADFWNGGVILRRSENPSFFEDRIHPGLLENLQEAGEWRRCGDVTPPPRGGGGGAVPRPAGRSPGPGPGSPLKTTTVREDGKERSRYGGVLRM